MPSKTKTTSASKKPVKKVVTKKTVAKKASTKKAFSKKSQTKAATGSIERKVQKIGKKAMKEAQVLGKEALKEAQEIQEKVSHLPFNRKALFFIGLVLILSPFLRSFGALINWAIAISLMYIGYTGRNFLNNKPVSKKKKKK